MSAEIGHAAIHTRLRWLSATHVSVTDEMTQSKARSEEVRRFLSRLEPFLNLSRVELDRVVSSSVERVALSGEPLLIEGGVPGTFLYVVFEGAVELAHQQVVIDIVTSGQVFGHPTLLTGLAPELTARARQDSTLICIPMDVALDLLGRPDGVKFVARTLRDRLIQSASALRALPDVRARPVGSLLREAPVFCDPDTTIRDAARLMANQSLTALLVQTRDGLGIVTDVDLRDKVIAAGISSDAAVRTIMSTPVRTVRADVMAPLASVEMMEAGVNHLPVVDESDRVAGILSASSLMALDALSPFALRHAIYSAPTETALIDASKDFPKLFVDLLDAHLDAQALTRVLTALSDALTSRLLELAFDRRGRPPVPYAWLTLGSGARTELTLASDQDNALAFADSDDPTVDDYFRLVSEDVNNGLLQCGFVLDPQGVLANNREWRMSKSEWIRVFLSCFGGWDSERLLRASIAFDFRQVAGDLSIILPLTNIMREAPKHARFLSGVAELATEIPSPLQGFRQRLIGPIDIKRSGLLPIQNLARYRALSRGISASPTWERLIATQEDGSESERSLRDAFESMSHLRLRHHANAIRKGRTPDNAIDTAALRPLTRLNLQEALRVVAAAQRRLPQRVALR